MITTTARNHKPNRLASRRAEPKSIPVTLRPGTENDAQPCGSICFRAFKSISEKHNFPVDFPAPDFVTGLLAGFLTRPDIYSVVAEVEGRVVGSNFLWESDVIAGVGPITVDPEIQNGGVGRQLMRDVLQRAAKKDFAGVRLVQAAFHNRSLSLYTKLGFDVREPLANINGVPLKKAFPGFPVRSATREDLEACNALCRRIHEHNRTNELLDAINRGSATVVERSGRITGYATTIGFFGHAVAEGNDDLKALIAAAPELTGPGFLLPTRNSDLFRWCLSEGLRVTQPMTLMSVGLYTEPRGAFLPSILF
jgi:GNAT superfamily N-acetyltransferase